MFSGIKMHVAFDSSNIQGFEIVGYDGKGLAYIGELTSAVITDSEFEVKPGSEYGFIRSSNNNSKLIFNSALDPITNSSESLSKIGLLRLEGDSTLELNSARLEIGVLESTAGPNKRTTIMLGSPAVISSATDVNDIVSGSLSVQASDYSVDSIQQKGGIWSYEGGYPTTPLSAQGCCYRRQNPPRRLALRALPQMVIVAFWWVSAKAAS